MMALENVRHVKIFVFFYFFLLILFTNKIISDRPVINKIYELDLISCSIIWRIMY